MSARLARGVLRGVIAAMAMTGMRAFTKNAGIVAEPPPDAIFRERAGGLIRKLPRKRRRAAVELAHWSYGGFGGAAFAALPEDLRRRAWGGPIYGLVVWAGFEVVLAPGLGLTHAKERRLIERAAFAVDHLLYGLVLAQTRRVTSD